MVNQLTNRRAAAPNASVLLGLALLLASARCATSHRAAGSRPVVALNAGSATDAWTALLERRASLASIQAYLRIHATAGQASRSFRATLFRDSSQRTLVEALTPLGTAAFTLFSDGTDAIFIDHLNRKVWRGPASSAADVEGDLVPAVDLPELALLVAALPMDSRLPATQCRSCSAGAGLLVMEQGEVRYTVGPAGLARAVVERRGERLEVDYSPPSFPPSALVIDRFLDGSPSPVQSLKIQILDLVSGPAVLSPPSIPSDYSCCAGR
jgi:hypothetical protein